MTKIEKVRNEIETFKSEEHIVEIHRIGNSTIKIGDNCCKEKSKEDIEAILIRCAEIVQVPCGAFNIDVSVPQ